MSAQNAKDAADDWIARQRLPANMKGRRVLLVIFQTEEDCRFFYPRRALDWQTQVNTYISRGIRPSGGRVWRQAITPADYHAWRGDRADTADLRREFADGKTGLEELPPSEVA